MLARRRALEFNSTLNHVVHEVFRLFVVGFAVVEDDGCEAMSV
jgi:hypothetical protein